MVLVRGEYLSFVATEKKGLNIVRRALRTNPTFRKFRDIKNSLALITESPLQKLVDYCDQYSITTVLDIGANIGQFSVDLRRNGYRGEIYSFEPVKRYFDALITTSKNDASWHPFNLALGKESGVTQINVSDNDGLSSSILPMGEKHKDAFPESEYKSSEEIRVSTINDEIKRLGINPSTTLLKMDVQGYEENVILGGLDHLKSFPLCFLETSLSPLYIGEATFLEILNLLDSLGHHLTDVFRGTKDKQGRLLQVDILTCLLER